MVDKKEKKPIIESLRGIVEAILLNSHTALPGIVETFNASDKTVSVKPALKRKYENGVIKELPVIPNVPIVYPQGSEALISFPLKNGDPVLLVFSERSIDTWKNKGGSVSPEDERKFDLTDAIAIPGVFHIGGGIEAKPASLLIKYKNFDIEITDAGKIKITNGTYDVIKIIDDTLTALTNMTINTMLGPQPPNNLATFITLKNQMGNFV